MVELPTSLINAVEEQNAVLFLGAGASYGASHPQGKTIPSGLTLRDLLSDRFLGGALKDRSLAAVAEFAANETSLGVVQQFVRDLFDPFAPAAFHNLLPTFRWKAIATTNYDLIVERSYKEVSDRLQTPVKRFKDGDSFDHRFKQEAAPLEYIKLHGCIDHYSDESIPLILGQEQYARYLKNRTRLYSRVRDLAHEHPFIFCGYRIEDPHVQQILFDLADTGISRPMYFHVSPNLGEYEARYWAKHRVAAGELLNSDGSIRELSGQVLRKEEGYAFVRLNGVLEDVFASRGDSADGEWNKLSAFKAVEGRLAFTRRGPRAVRIRSVD